MANNPYVNFVKKGDGTTVMDIRDSTVVANKMASGTYAYDASGAKIQGGLVEQGAATITPSDSQQTAVASGRYTTGAVTVAAVPTETKTATGNGTITPTEGKYLSSVTVAIPEQAATTITPTTSAQTAVEAGKLTTGAVTVAAVPTETPSTITENGTYTATSGNWWTEITVNVQSGSSATPLSVTANGTYTAPTGQSYNPVTVAVPTQTYYTGNADPSSSLGNDGDLYFKEG